MKYNLKLLTVTVLALSIILAACSESKQPDKNDSGMKVIPIEKKQEIAVQSIEEIFEGWLCDVSGDKTKALVRWKESSGSDYKNYLGELDLKDLSVEKLTSENTVGNAQYFPDASRLTLFKNSDCTSQVWQMDNKQGAQLEKLPTDNISGGFLSFYKWAPDHNNYVTALSYEDGYEAEMLIYGKDNKLVKRVRVNDGSLNGDYNLYYNGVTPCFVDNTTLLFASTDGIKTMNFKASEGKARKIADAHNFALSADKQYLAYAKPAKNGEFVIKVDVLDDNLNVAYTKAETNIKTLGDNVFPVDIKWSPDSSCIIFTNQNYIWVLDINNGEYKQLISNMEFIYEMEWVDNKTILFNRAKTEPHNYSQHVYRVVVK